MSVYKKQKDLIEEKEWDFLVVLDACRFDFFRDLYENHLDGKLRKVISKGSQTSEWIRKTFKDSYHNAIYVSANPYVNSKGVKLAGLDCRMHFEKIFDAWETEWDDEIKTVRPENMGELSLLVREKYPDKRIISHFMQPHTPYLSLEYKDEDFFQLVNAAGKENSNQSHSNKRLDKIKSIFEDFALKFFGWKNTQKLKGVLNLPNQLSQAGPSELVAKKVGREGLISAYKRNLKRVLSEVSKLSERLPGKIVVTSDHGELLGEEGMYGHYRAFDHPILKEVPWLKVTNSQALD